MTRGHRNVSEPRRHPDLFTKGEAAVYLHLAADAADEAGQRAVDNLRERGLLHGIPLSKELVYTRRELDAVVTNLEAKVLGPAANQRAALEERGRGVRMKVVGV